VDYFLLKKQNWLRGLYEDMRVKHKKWKKPNVKNKTYERLNDGIKETTTTRFALEFNHH